MNECGWVGGNAQHSSNESSKRELSSERFFVIFLVTPKNYFLISVADLTEACNEGKINNLLAVVTLIMKFCV